ncbi:MAG: hypothetical protein ACT4PU_00470 [Planctomycetota bacterium]
MTSHQAWVIELERPSRPVLLAATDRQRLADVAAACGCDAPRPLSAGEAPDLRLSESDAAFRLSGAECPTRTARNLGELLLRLEQALDVYASRPASGTVLLHASAVADPQGRAILLAGPSGAGKSTTAAALALSGAEWLGDECLPVLLDPPAVEPCRRPIALRQDVIEWISMLGLRGPARHELVGGAGKQYWGAGGLRRSAATHPLPLHRLVVLDAAATSIEPLDAGAAFAALLASCHLFQQQGAETFRELAELCRRVPALRFHARGGPRAVAALSQRLELTGPRGS